MSHLRIVRAGVVVALVTGTGVIGAVTTALAEAPTRSVESVGAKKKPKASATQIKALAAALDLPKSVIKRGLKGLETGDAEQEQSGSTPLPADPALDIQYFTSFAGASGETLFVMKLAAAPASAGVDYEYGVGVALEGQPLTTSNPTATEGFGRVALSRVFYLVPGDEIFALNPAANFAAVQTAAAALVVDVFVVFRIPDSELGAGPYYLQAFGRQGATAESPAGFSIVTGELAS